MVLSLALAAMAVASPARGDYDSDMVELNDKLDSISAEMPVYEPVHRPAKRWDEFTPEEHAAMSGEVSLEPVATPEPKPICSVHDANGVKVVACWGQAVKFIYPDGTVKDH
jgi:hypothetical protein